MACAWRAPGQSPRPGIMEVMSKSSSRRFPVTVTHLPVMRCQICHRTVVPARHPYRGPDRALPPRLPRSARLPFLVAGHRDQHHPPMPPRASAGPGRPCRRPEPEDASGDGAWPIQGQGRACIRLISTSGTTGWPAVRARSVRIFGHVRTGRRLCGPRVTRCCSLLASQDGGRLVRAAACPGREQGPSVPVHGRVMTVGGGIFCGPGGEPGRAGLPRGSVAAGLSMPPAAARGLPPGHVGSGARQPAWARWPGRN